MQSRSDGAKTNFCINFTSPDPRRRAAGVHRRRNRGKGIAKLDVKNYSLKRGAGENGTPSSSRAYKKETLQAGEHDGYHSTKEYMNADGGSGAIQKPLAPDYDATQICIKRKSDLERTRFFRNRAMYHFRNA